MSLFILVILVIETAFLVALFLEKLFELEDRAARRKFMRRRQKVREDLLLG